MLNGSDKRKTSTGENYETYFQSTMDLNSATSLLNLTLCISYVSHDELPHILPGEYWIVYNVILFVHLE